MTTTLLMSKSAIPVVPNTGDIRGFFNSDGIWCSEDEFGNVIVYANSLSVNPSKAGVVSAVTFTGNPKTASVTFTTPFVDNNYAVNITGVDNRNWTAESLTSSGFVINANANKDLISQVFWNATHSGS
jgi:hypothetical protein